MKKVAIGILILGTIFTVATLPLEARGQSSELRENLSAKRTAQNELKSLQGDLREVEKDIKDILDGDYDSKNKAAKNCNVCQINPEDTENATTGCAYTDLEKAINEGSTSAVKPMEAISKLWKKNELFESSNGRSSSLTYENSSCFILHDKFFSDEAINDFKNPRRAVFYEKLPSDCVRHITKKCKPAQAYFKRAQLKLEIEAKQREVKALTKDIRAECEECADVDLTNPSGFKSFSLMGGAGGGVGGMAGGMFSLGGGYGSGGMASLSQPRGFAGDFATIAGAALPFAGLTAGYLLQNSAMNGYNNNYRGYLNGNLAAGFPSMQPGYVPGGMMGGGLLGGGLMGGIMGGGMLGIPGIGGIMGGGMIGGGIMGGGGGGGGIDPLTLALLSQAQGSMGPALNPYGLMSNGTDSLQLQLALMAQLQGQSNPMMLSNPLMMMNSPMFMPSSGLLSNPLMMSPWLNNGMYNQQMQLQMQMQMQQQSQWAQMQQYQQLAWYQQQMQYQQQVQYYQQMAYVQQAYRQQAMQVASQQLQYAQYSAMQTQYQYQYAMQYSQQRYQQALQQYYYASSIGAGGFGWGGMGLGMNIGIGIGGGIGGMYSPWSQPMGGMPFNPVFSQGPGTGYYGGPLGNGPWNRQPAMQCVTAPCPGQ